MRSSAQECVSGESERAELLPLLLSWIPMNMVHVLHMLSNALSLSLAHTHIHTRTEQGPAPIALAVCVCLCMWDSVDRVQKNYLVESQRSGFTTNGNKILYLNGPNLSLLNYYIVTRSLFAGSNPLKDLNLNLVNVLFDHYFPPN